MLQTQDLKDFSITSWYEQFKQVTIETAILKICPELLKLFRANDFDYTVREVCKKEYLEQIEDIIKSFPEGAAFAKDNWHAPIDAKFISFGNCLKVCSLDDLVLYFTASETIAADLENDKYDSFVMAFKPFMNIHPASEFRCIVVNNILRGITPRDWPTYYPHYTDDGPEIITSINNFFINKIQGNFNRTHYTFDVIIDPEKVILVDFGPLNSKTNYYAFSWQEIQPILKKNSSVKVAPVFRYLETDMGIMTKSEALQKFKNSHRLM